MLLEPVPDLVIVGTATLGDRGASPSTDDADVVLVDAGHGTTEDASDLADWFKRPLVILGIDRVDLSRFPPATRGIAILDRGAKVDEITAAIRAAAHALLVVDARLIERANAGLDDRRPDLGESLSSRELDVLSWMAEGWPNREIARRLGISEHTVKYHVSAILAKLRAQNRTEAVATAARLGLINL